jgi:nucleotide-binding universal stress UspA family protein
MYETILVPTDGSDVAAGAAEHAFDLARAFDATVHVLYVIDESASRLLLDTHSVGTVLEALSEEGEAATDALADGAGDVETIASVVRGMHIADTIVEYAAEHDADVIVMGTQGRRGVKRVVGSVTERVLARASVPVLALSATSIEAGDAEVTIAEHTENATGDDE